MAPALLLFLLLLLPLHLPSVTSEIITTTITNDPRPTIHFADFGFTEKGRVSLVLTNVSTTTTSSTPLNASRIGFQLFQYYGIIPDYSLSGQSCINEDPYLFRDSLYPVASFEDLSGPATSAYFNRTIKVPKERRYGVFFSNCLNHTNVSMHVELKIYNVNPDGTRDYLPDTLDYVPNVYFTFATFYVVLALVWMFHGWVNREAFHKIHWAMTLLLITKCLSLYFAGNDKLYESQTGSPHGWDTVFYAFQFLRGVLFCTVIMLIGFGWSAMKPVLDGAESLVMAFGITIQIVVQALYVLTQELGSPIEPFSGLFWAVGALDLLSALAIMIPFQMSLSEFKRTAAADGTAVRTLKLMRVIRAAMGATFFYLYIFWSTKLFILNTDNDVCAEDTEVEFPEVMTAVYYVVLFWLLKPTAEGDYMNIDEHMDEEKALQIIHGSEFADV